MQRFGHTAMLRISGASFWTPEGGELVEVDILGPSDLRRRRRRRYWLRLTPKAARCGWWVSESLLYNWRSARKAAAVAMGAPEDSVIEGPITRSPPIWRRRNSGHGTVG